MNIVTFREVDASLLNEHNVINFDSLDGQKADIIILDINTIFDFEENKGHITNDPYVSIAVVDDESDYDAFKNFGIDAWIQGSDLDQINKVVNLVRKRFLS